MSPRIGTFAQVDVLPGDVDPWKANRFVREIRSEGDRAEGTLSAGGYVFAWEARRFRVGAEQVILATGNVVDEKRSKAIETAGCAASMPCSSIASATMTMPAKESLRLSRIGPEPSGIRIFPSRIQRPAGTSSITAGSTSSIGMG